MQKTLKILMALALSHSVHAAGMAEIVKNVKEVCLTPSEQGKFWNVTATGGAKADGTIVKLIATGINGQATFTKGEWDGIQQVLQKDQLDDNKRYTHCIEYLTPLFINKFATAPAAPPKPAPKPVAKTNTPKPKPIATAKPATPPPAATPAPAAESKGDTNTQTIGSQTAEKIINATEINGNIDMGN